MLATSELSLRQNEGLGLATLHFSTFYQAEVREGRDTKADGLLTNNLHGKLWAIVGACWDILDLAKGEHAVDDSAKDDVLSVKEVALRGCDEELE